MILLASRKLHYCNNTLTQLRMNIVNTIIMNGVFPFRYWINIDMRESNILFNIKIKQSIHNLLEYYPSSNLEVKTYLSNDIVIEDHSNEIIYRDIESMFIIRYNNISDSNKAKYNKIFIEIIEKEKTTNSSLLNFIKVEITATNNMDLFYLKENICIIFLNLTEKIHIFI